MSAENENLLTMQNGIIVPSDITKTPVNPQTVTPSKQTVLKNLLLCNVADSTGCGNLRAVFPFTYLFAAFGKKINLHPILTTIPIRQHEVLVATRSVWFQRTMSQQHYNSMNFYAQMKNTYKYKIVYDLDDYLWGKNEKQGGDKRDGIPSYNFAWEIIGDELKTWSMKIMEDLVDTVTVSTETLAKEIQKRANKKLDIRVLPNAVPKYLYGEPERRPPIIEKIKKPRVLYAGAPGHYSNRDKMKGDFDNAWYDWILKAIKEDKIEFIVMGGMPWFFEGLKDKIHVIDWINAFQYPATFRALRPNFVFMPLVPNIFNACKSDIKYIETCAIGAVGIGTHFKGELVSPYDNCIVKVPYDCTVSDIEAIIDKYSEPEHYNRVVTEQYDMMENTGRWIESPKYINCLTKLI
jgi:hypothetical protein